MLGRVVREAKLQTKLVERSSGKLGPIPFPHQEAVKEVIDSLEREGFFSKTCTLIPSGCDELSFFSLLSFYLEDGSRNQLLIHPPTHAQTTTAENISYCVLRSHSSLSSQSEPASHLGNLPPLQTQPRGLGRKALSLCSKD